MHGFDINGVNNVTGTGYTRSTSNVGKTNEIGTIKLTTTPKEESFYPGLNLSYEARMEAEMNKSPFINDLNKLFGIA